MESGYATIDIGGTLRRADIDEFVKTAIEDYCYPLDGGATGASDAQDIHEEISAAHNEKRPIRLAGDDVPWAEFDSLETLCQKLGLTYARESAALPGVCGELVRFWEPGMEEGEDIASGDSALMLNIETIRKHRRDGALDDVLDRLERIEKFDIPLVLEGSMADGPSEPHDCSACGFEGTDSAAHPELAWCTKCEIAVPRKHEKCPNCGDDTLILACPKCGGPWRHSDPMEAIASAP